MRVTTPGPKYDLTNGPYSITVVGVKIKISACFACLALCAISAQGANADTESVAPNAAESDDRHMPARGPVHLYLGVNFATVRYVEPDIGVTHNGRFFPGLVAKLALEDPDQLPIFASARYKHQSGTYDYSGYIQDLAGVRTPYYDSALPQSKYDLEFLAGYLNNTFKVFGGAQYENWTDKAYTVNRNFYKRARESWYGVVGAAAKLAWEDYRSLELVIKAKPLISGDHYSRLSDMGCIFENVGTTRNNQSRGFRFEISFEYQYEMLFLEPYFSYTRIPATKFVYFDAAPGISGRIQEPANTSAEFGVNMGIRF